MTLFKNNSRIWINLRFVLLLFWRSCLSCLFFLNWCPALILYVGCALFFKNTYLVGSITFLLSQVYLSSFDRNSVFTSTSTAVSASICSSYFATSLSTWNDIVVGTIIILIILDIFIVINQLLFITNHLLIIHHIFRLISILFGGATSTSSLSNNGWNFFLIFIVYFFFECCLLFA